MPYFVRAYREYLAAGATGSILLFPNVPVFRKANSILFSPACASKRYAGRTPNSAKPTFTGDFNEAQGIPVPRLLFNLYMMAQRPLHCPAPTHGAEGAPTPPISASRPGFAAAVSLLGWLHGNTPASGLDSPGASPLPCSLLRYVGECALWTAVYPCMWLLGGKHGPESRLLNNSRPPPVAETPASVVVVQQTAAPASAPSPSLAPAPAPEPLSSPPPEPAPSLPSMALPSLVPGR